MNDSLPSGTAQIWGERVIEGTYAGHPGLLYERAPSSLPALLNATEAWQHRDFMVQGDVRISHRDFRDAIPAAARKLTDLGVGRGDRVLLRSFNRPEFVLATWAAWWLGAVPVYANRWWSDPEIEHSLRIVEPVLILSDAPQAMVSEYGEVRSIFDLSGLWDDGRREPAPELDVDLDDPALILFTSGSSGAPKGVQLSVRSLIANQHNLLAMSRRLPQYLDTDKPQTVTLVCTPLFHIGGVSAILTNLITGGRLVLTAGRFDAGEILHLIDTEGVQTWGGVPTMAVRLLEHPDFESHDLSSLRSFPLGGAPLPPALLERMRTKLPQLRERGLANTWGMTETGGFMTLARNAELESRPGTVGKPYPVVELRIASPDEDGSGEVLVRAPTVMLGYVGLDDGTVDADGWLHTGDIGHLDDDGYLYLDGRSKDIVIRGGENIACAHVEQHLLRHPSVIEAAVFGVPHDELGEELAAAVTYRQGEPVDAAALRAHCESALAYYEIPTLWQIDATPLPTLAGEKLDKKTIKATFHQQTKDGR